MVVVTDRVVLKKVFRVFLKQDNLGRSSVQLKTGKAKKTVAWVLFYPVLFGKYGFWYMIGI